ncbi:prepilin-type N-terminal cleavage/methylation domain-containing protein [Tamilnaduibacter salinus]|uniref:Prepilin-type N-terminal cleavage/methylation domain-containing protein n=1 Tax=Tamilnaduibacter salinus TaxID=1484056 RepID=A0A2A2HZA8_9GAMM|nr:prepilin-type N-terminal cleavage/methylation domain-containing protein [Tamilnaduibacter salinus]PAV25021.1 hypothetical protein CF392_13205 [Tamilnaduibacter salinus]PVY79073.1 prepilin-type N-terminal cleavage/methylation domain-containing protein [Tamilnaduibacter salinus]
MSQRCEKGMTLMELLVAMVIGSLVITLVVRGLGLSLNLYDRVAKITSSVDVRFREAQWWTGSIASLVPCTDIRHCVEGTSTELVGYTFAPILDSAGKRTPITWRLQERPGESVLTYREGNNAASTPLEMNLALPRDAAFGYLQPDGEWVNEWGGDGGTTRLPVAVRIEDASGGVWAFGATMQRPYGRDDYRDMLGE